MIEGRLIEMVKNRFFSNSSKMAKAIMNKVEEEKLFTRMSEEKETMKQKRFSTDKRRN